MDMRLTTRRRIRLGTTVGLVTVGLIGAVGFGSAPATATAAPAAVGTADSSSVPPEIKVPPGNKLVAEFDAQGVQVYQCAAGAWSFLEPAAVLSTRSASAVHFRGPSSLVEGRAVASSPVAGAIPQLLLQATRTRGEGVFGGVTYIQRLNTTGGTAPTTACTDGQTKGVPYTADYRFYVAA